MTAGGPIECAWTGEVFRPVSPYWVRRADKDYTVGEVIKIVEMPERSAREEHFYFASIDNAFDSLPPLRVEQFKSALALRKWALIQAGYCYSETMVCASPQQAQALAAFVRGLDEFCVVEIRRSVVTVSRAKSQSRRAMDKETFKQSKEDTLRIIADMLDTTKKELSDAGKNCA